MAPGMFIWLRWVFYCDIKDVLNIFSWTKLVQTFYLILKELNINVLYRLHLEKFLTQGYALSFSNV